MPTVYEEIIAFRDQAVEMRLAWIKLVTDRIQELRLPSDTGRLYSIIQPLLDAAYRLELWAEANAPRKDTL